MTAPRPRPAARDASAPDQALERLMVKVGQWRSEPSERRAALADELVKGFANLAEKLASGGAELPSQWAGATPPAPELPPSGTDAEVEAAQAALTAAEQELAAAEATELEAHEAREVAARALGEARKTFYDLARVRDLSRP